MRPTVIRLIVGGALGIAFSISVTLPGALVLPQDHPKRHLATPDAPSTTVVRAAPVAAPRTAPTPRRGVVRAVHVPAIRTAPVVKSVRYTPTGSRPATNPVERTSPPAQALTTMVAPPVVESKDEPGEAESATQPKKAKPAKKPKKADAAKPKKAKPEQAKPAKKAKPTKPKKAKKRGEEKEESGDRGKKDEGREKENRADD